MSKRKIQVFIEVCYIRPGGGPPGYVYNFLEGLKKIELKENVPVNITTFTEPNSLRENTISIIKSKNIISKININIHKLIPDLFRRIKLKKSKKWKELIKNDIIVFHGYQEAIEIEEASKIAKTVYMPHCPTIAADEFKMTNNALGLKFSKKDYLKAVGTERRLINSAHYIVFASKGASEEYWKYYKNELQNKKIEYINSGIDLPKYALNKSSQIKNENISEGFVLFAGRYVSHKGYDLFCKAAEYISKIDKKIKFVSIGGGANMNFEYVNDLNWQENPYEYMKAASVIVIPNKFAYYDLFPLECAALGKPLVMTAVGGNVDQINELPDTIGCSPTVEDLSRSIIFAYEKVKQNPKWGMNNQIKYNSFFDSESFARRWVIFLEKITNLQT